MTGNDVVAAVHGKFQVLERAVSIAEALKFQDLGTIRSFFARKIASWIQELTYLPAPHDSSLFDAKSRVAGTRLQKLYEAVRLLDRYLS